VLKKRSFSNQCNLLCRSVLDIKRPGAIVVLTEKTGLFWGGLAAKTMFREIKMILCFAFLPVVRRFCLRKSLHGSNKHRYKPSKKNHTKKPTVGFLVFKNWRKVVSMMNDKSVDQRDERDAKPALRDFFRAIRGSLPKLNHGFHGFHGLAAVSGQSNRGRTNAFSSLRALRGKTRLRSRKSLISMIVSDSFT
jgi:hypothetical protein